MDAKGHVKIGASKLASSLIFIKAFLALLAGQPDTKLLIVATHTFMGIAVRWRQVWVLLFVFILFTVNIPVYLIDIVNPSGGSNMLLQLIFGILDIAVSVLVFRNYRYYFNWTK